MNSRIKVLSKVVPAKTDTSPTEVSDEDVEPIHLDSTGPLKLDLGSWFRQKLKHESEAKVFKLIDERDWNIAPTEPPSESTFFSDGHSALSIISVIGPKGVGKSSLLNKIARKEAFKTYQSCSKDGVSKINVKHTTRGIDILSTHHRMLLDCQPLLATSVLEDFLSGQSNSQFPKNIQNLDPLTSCYMISLQLATFLIATSDYVIIMNRWLIDVHILKLIASAIMMIGEDNLRAKFIVYSNNKRIHSDEFLYLIHNCLGKKRIDKYFDDENELMDYIAPYSSEKCELYNKDPATFTGKNWLSSCQRLWNTTIKNSSMFSDYAIQLSQANNINI